MAKSSITGGNPAEPVHTRTSGGTEDSQVFVLGLDGSDSLVGADTANGLDVDVTRVPSAASATVTQVASSATVVTLQASNASRKGLSIFNDSTAALFVKFGSAASATSFTVKIAAAGYWEMPPSPVYTGIVTGLWSSANGNALVTEV